jgi:hypothetical protein
MTTRLIRILLAFISLLTAALVSSVISASGPASAAEYCVYHDPTYVGSRQVVPGSEYCVPGP